MAIIRGFRCLALIAIIAGLAGAAAITHQAVAQDSTTAAVIEGTCEAPGDVAAELRDLKVADGGALTSFTTIDLALEEVTNDEFTVVVGDPTEPTACGEITGEGTDVYIALSAQADSTIGGVAWLHARDERTQVSLFLGEGLGGSADGNEEPDGDSPPEPPIDETPEPLGNEVTYTSPSYGYTVTYDSDFWTVTAEEVRADPDGPVDHFALSNENSIIVEYTGVSGATVDAKQFTENYLSGFKDLPAFSGVTIRLDADGNEIRGGDSQHAFIAFDFEGESEFGETVLNTFYVNAWLLPSSGELLAMTFLTEQNEYDRWTPYREQLEAGMTFPE